MTYSFHIIKSNVQLLLFILLPVFIFMVLILISHTNGMDAYLPHLFVKSITIPIYACIIVAIVIIWNKKKLFWAKIMLEIDKDTSTLKINGDSMNFRDLEYYEYRPGSALTTRGIPGLFFKFKTAGQKMIMPCKSSPDFNEYNQFRIEFDHIIRTLNLEKKKKKLGKFGRIVLTSICVLIPLVIIGLGLSKGSATALKLFPSLLILGTICGVYLYQDRKKS